MLRIFGFPFAATRVFHQPEAPAREAQEGTQKASLARWRCGFVFQHENKRNFKKRQRGGHGKRLHDLDDWPSLALRANVLRQTLTLRDNPQTRSIGPNRARLSFPAQIARQRSIANRDAALRQFL